MNRVDHTPDVRMTIRPPATQEQIQIARDIYQNEDCEIDDDAVISDAMPEGVWVQAWVWISSEDMGINT